MVVGNYFKNQIKKPRTKTFLKKDWENNETNNAIKTKLPCLL